MGPNSGKRSRSHGYGLRPGAAWRVRVVALSCRRSPEAIRLGAVAPQERVSGPESAVRPRVEMPDLSRASGPADPQHDQLAAARNVATADPARDADPPSPVGASRPDPQRDPCRHDHSSRARYRPLDRRLSVLSRDNPTGRARRDPRGPTAVRGGPAHGHLPEPP